MRVGRAVELLCATLDEVEQVAVVAGEVGRRRSQRVLEGARQDLLAVGEGLGPRGW